MQTSSDLHRLWSIQIERRKQWMSIQGTFLLSALAAPILLAITRQEPQQLLKLGYPFIGFFLGMVVNQLGSSTSFLSALFSAAICFILLSITLPIAQWIAGMSPEPGWYIAVIPLYAFIDLNNETIIPIRERLEWKKFKTTSGISSKEMQAELENVDVSIQNAQKTHANIFSLKPETFWEKLWRRMNRIKNDNKPSRLTSTTEIRVETDELHDLQRQVNESLKRIRYEPGSRHNNTADDTAPPQSPFSQHRQRDSSDDSK